MNQSCLFLLFVFLWGHASSEENWPRFRGKDGMGISTEAAPTTLNAESLRWSSTLPGPGSSSPVIWGDLLFVTSEDRQSQTISLSALEIATGQTKWIKRIKVGEYHLHRFNNTAASSPAVNAECVVISWFDASKPVAMLSAFDHSGKKLWDYEIGNHTSQHGLTLHPVIHDEQVIINHLHQDGGYVGAISTKNGTSLWKKTYPGGTTSYVTPLVRSFGDGHEVVISATSIGVVGIDLDHGKERWSIPSLMKERCIVSPIDILAGSGKQDSLLAVGCKNGVYFTVRPPIFKAQNQWSKPEVVWNMKGKMPYVPTPVSDGKTLYALSDGGTLTAINAQSGEILWTERLPGNFYASPLLVDGKLYALSREGEMFVAQVGTSYTEIDRSGLNPGPEVQWADSTPVATNGKLFVRLGARIDCFGVKK